MAGPRSVGELGVAAPPAVRLPPPAVLRQEMPASAEILAGVGRARQAIRDVLDGRDQRLLVTVGPCSVHDADAARSYAEWLAEQAARHQRALLIVMRVYVEKPRTRHGWTGLLNDPDLDGSANIAKGLSIARRLFLDVTRLGLPVATEVLGLLTPPYLMDLVSWTAVGARTVESPLHRWMASGWPCPVGFKNTVGGDVDAAISAVLVARQPQASVTIDDHGRMVAMSTSGNRAGHIVLRGGPVPNHGHLDVMHASTRLMAAGLPGRVLIDCGHGNAQGTYERQVDVARDVGTQIVAGSNDIAGISIESNLVAGRQPLRGPLAKGLSITDGCLGLEDTSRVLELLSAAQLESSPRRRSSNSRSLLPRM